VTSARQWTANRENAQKSTGPRTEEGKRRSRRNALRHGLTAETVVEGLEDTEDYRAFEATIIADYDAHTAVERELVLRLRRCCGAFAGRPVSKPICCASRPRSFAHVRKAVVADLSPNAPQSAALGLPRLGYRVLRSVGGVASEDAGPNPQESERGCQPGDKDEAAAIAPDETRQFTHCFLRLANLDNAIFDRLSRYEAVLWRQAVQAMFALEPVRRQRYRSGSPLDWATRPS
jgi:hypothetical protein